MGGDEDINRTRCALAMIENVESVLAELNELQLWDNTIVWYFLDNGPNNSRWTGMMKREKGGHLG